MANELPKIMTKPLPKILDELEEAVNELREAIAQAQKATVEARKAGEEARAAGIKAAAEAGQVALAKTTEAEDRMRQAMELLAGEIRAAAKVAADALQTAKLALSFAQLVDKADVAALNAASRTRNEIMAEWKS